MFRHFSPDETWRSSTGISLARLAIMLIALIPWLNSKLSAQTPVVLRDLSLKQDCRVVRFTHSKIYLSDNSELYWDQVLKAEVETERQQEFDTLIQTLGTPLYLIRFRLQQSDWPGVCAIADSLANQFPDDASLQTALQYISTYSHYRQQLIEGERQQALIQFLKLCQLQPKLDNDGTRLCAGQHLSNSELKQQLSSKILPIWFDATSVNQLKEQIKPFVDDRPGGLIYLVAAHQAMEELELSQMLVERLENISTPETKDWIQLLKLRNQQLSDTNFAATAFEKLANSNDAVRPLAWYFSGALNRPTAEPNLNPKLSDLELSKASLSLLRIPSNYGNTYRSLSAAALYQSVQLTEQRNLGFEARKLNEELLKQYSKTYHGRMAKSKETP